MPARCTFVEDLCEDGYATGVNGVLQTELEFAGYSLVDAETLVSSARTRDEVSEELKLFGEKVAQAKSRRRIGALFEDLPLAEAHADGIVQAKLVIPARASAISPARENNTVQVRVGMSADGSELGWIAQCSRMSGLHPTVAIELEDAAQCAIQDAIAQTR
ncbi:MAG: hypothetical protein IRZ16_07920 [Myxococcaceae bacterium]|nr:hypothetical protein [Myxococcaceae bacterium]